MTANELAYKLDEIYTGTDYEDIKLAAIMLRQQAQEIESLKALAISLSHRNANLQYTRIEK